MEPDKDAAGFLSLDLANFKKHCDELAGRWNGDLPGRLEDEAHVCTDISRTIDELQKLLDEFLEM